MRQVKERRDEILEAAEQLVFRFGPRRMTMEDVSEEIGISRPAVYQYFQNKNALLRAVAENIHQKSLKRVSTELERTGDLSRCLSSALNARDGYFFDEIKLTGKLPWYLDPKNENIQDILNSSQNVYKVMLKRYLTRQRFPEAETETTVSLLIAVSAGLRLTLQDQDSFQDVLQTSVAQILSLAQQSVVA